MKNIEEPKSLNLVKDFHLAFKAPVLENPSLIPEKRSNLRINLIQEELDELKKAIEKKDLIEITNDKLNFFLH